MNLGARQASGDVLLFLHADTILPFNFMGAVEGALRDGGWGRFDVVFDRSGPLLTVVARAISWRSRLTRMAGGDQAIFVRRDLFEQVGGYQESDLFEDLDLCRRLKRQTKMGVATARVVTSSRRWRAGGTVATVLLMWVLRVCYLAGVPSSTLSRFYADRR
jgi:cellulose synthase/poly-beta-1,6-N-acetylglucosamine synthase-like glycosyltransferase